MEVPGGLQQAGVEIAGDDDRLDLDLCDQVGELLGGGQGSCLAPAEGVCEQFGV
ncbi:MAG TPA: hypothetical protein PLZ93_03880 [Nocardioides sp.]|uniref:hypothetical protein n=1 Tax=uncultured Nocardioides sp. TaxID=198441 RepID=UPI002632D4F4|nr:hypothetical protein [uncultured Nocardioides sp.]HRD59502.1 hypothetical protein [Nocardioides sp.]HRI94731.1 hypothetical protein [Nocardioides sp.]HRK44622.1 hypothetical protein [Nocardioides sp.]